MSARHSTELRKDKISNLDERVFNRVAHTSRWETKSLIFRYSFILPLVTHFLSTLCLLLALSLFPWLHQRGLLMIWSFTKYLFANGCETEWVFFFFFASFFYEYFTRLVLPVSSLSCFLNSTRRSEEWAKNFSRRALRADSSTLLILGQEMKKNIFREFLWWFSGNESH